MPSTTDLGGSPAHTGKLPRPFSNFQPFGAEIGLLWPARADSGLNAHLKNPNPGEVPSTRDPQVIGHLRGMVQFAMEWDY